MKTTVTVTGEVVISRVAVHGIHSDPAIVGTLQ